MSNMNERRVAVLRGGPSEAYPISMETGKAVLGALRELRYPHRDVVITKQGEWLESGFVRTPETLLSAVDVVFIALHGAYGEDGQVQRVIGRHNIPYTGSRALSSSIAFNKDLTKQSLRLHNIAMPRHRRVTRAELPYLEDEIANIFKEVGSELFVKPVSDGSSLGAVFVPHADALRRALSEQLERCEQVLVEEYIRGREATVGVLTNFRNERLYALPVVEIIPPNTEPYLSYEHKNSGHAEGIVPGRFSYHEKSRLAEAATIAHDAIGCDHYSRSDFIVRDGEVYFLEVNTLPDLTPRSLFPKASGAVGLSFPQLVQHLVETATA